MMPAVKEAAVELSGKAKVIKIDIDKNLALANKYRIMGVPTLMIFQQGEIKWRQAGVLTKQQLVEAVQKVL